MTDILTDQMHSAGGVILITLAILSMAACATAIYKIIQFIYLGVGRHRQARRIVEHWCAGRRDQALQEAEGSRNPLTRVIYDTMNGIIASNSQHKDEAREVAINTASQELAQMSRFVRLLEAVVQAAPMLGLLGTVLGMIEAFERMSNAGGAVDPAALAGGIWTALTTTAAGLTIAIPFYFISIWFEGKIERERKEMEFVIFSLMHAAR